MIKIQYGSKYLSSDSVVDIGGKNCTSFVMQPKGREGIKAKLGPPPQI